jgi:hypothetical protein
LFDKLAENSQSASGIKMPTIVNREGVIKEGNTDATESKRRDSPINRLRESLNSAIPPEIIELPEIMKDLTEVGGLK